MEEKENVKKRKKIDKSRLAIKIVAGILALIFVASMCTTCVFYIMAQ